MPVTITVTQSGAGTGNGTETDPYQSGGIYFKAKVTGGSSSIKLVWNHRWTVGGFPVPDNINTPEMWYGRDGMALSPSFHPNGKTSLSEVTVTVYVQGYESEAVSLKSWVMAKEDEPTPQWTVETDADNDSLRVVKDELFWLRNEGYTTYAYPDPNAHYPGTKLMLMELLATREPVEPPVDPPIPPEPEDFPFEVGERVVLKSIVFTVVQVNNISRRLVLAEEA